MNTMNRGFTCLLFNIKTCFAAVLLLTGLTANPVQAKLCYTIKDLGTLGGTYSVGNDINNVGQVTGYSSITGDSAYHAFISDGTTMTDLGTLGGSSSIGHGINNAGQVTGKASTISGDNHAFISDGTTMTDLGTLGGESGVGFIDSVGLGINDAGLVTG